MTNPGVDAALDRLFANATREGLSRIAEPEQLDVRPTGLPGGDKALLAKSFKEPPPTEPPPTEPPIEPPPVEKAPLRGFFSIPQSSQEWIDNFTWWGKQALGKGMESLYRLPGMPTVFRGAEQFQEIIAEPLGALVSVYPWQVEMPEPTDEQEALLKELERKGFPRYMPIESLEWYSKNGTELTKQLITPEVIELLRPYKQATTERAFWNQRIKQYKRQPEAERFVTELAVTWPLFPGGKATKAFQMLKPDALNVASHQIGRVIPKAIDKMPDLMPVEGMLEAAVRPDNAKKLAELPGMGKIAKVFAGEGGLAKIAKGASEVDLGHAFKLGQAMLREQAKAASTVLVSKLNGMGDSFKVFNLVDNVKSPQFGTIKSGPLKGVHLNTIRKNPSKYMTDLTDKQAVWVQEANHTRDLLVDYLESHGIKFAKSDLAEIEKWVSKGVMAKVDDAGEVTWARIGPTVKGIGGKASFEKMPTFKTAEEGLAHGFRYLPEESRLYFNLQDAYRKVADKELAEWFLGRVEWRSKEVFSLPKLNNLINTALKKEAIKKQSIQALKRDMPELAAKFEQALAIPDWETRFVALKELKETLRTLVPSETDKLFWATEKLQQKVKLAEDAIKALQRVKRGERLPTGTIKAIAKIMPESKSKLTEVSRYTLDDLIKAGEEASEWPKTLKRGAAFPSLEKSTIALKAAQKKLLKNPENAAMFREVQKLKRKVAFAKYRLAQEGDIELTKSPVSILKGKHYDAIDELVATIRGNPSKGITATGKPKIAYSGGLLQKFKAESAKAAKLRSEVSETAKKVHWGEAEIQQPAFQGRILTGKEAPKIAEMLRSSVPTGFQKALQTFNVPNSIARYFALAADLSLFPIHLLLSHFVYPKAIGQAYKGFAKALFDPVFHSNLIAKKADVIFRHPNLQLVKSTRTEFHIRWAERVPILRNFQRAFETGLDAAGIHMAESMDILNQTGRITGWWGKVERAWGLEKGWQAESALYRASQTDAFINEWRGILSPSRLGIGTTQREMERALVLAPMYMRATAATLTDAFRGNIRGYMARRALIKGAAGMAAMISAVTVALSENKNDPEKLAQEIADHLNPASGSFGTWLIAGQNVGPGSKWRSYLKLIAESAENPKRLVELTMNNPAYRFAYGNLSPNLRTGYGLIAGRQPFTGEETRSDALNFSRTVLGRNLLPLWIQSVIWERGESPPGGVALKGAVEFGGMRSYPETPYQKLEKKRNQLAMEKYGMLWEELGMSEDSLGRPTPGDLAKDELEQSNPELKELTRLAREQSSKLAQGTGVIWDRWYKEEQDIQKKFNDGVDKEVTHFKSMGDGTEFRKAIDALAVLRRHDFDKRKYHSDYTLIKDYFDEPLTEKQRREMNLKDLARREYYEMMFAPDIYDQWGDYDFEEADRREQLFIERYGQETLDYVEKFSNLKITNPVYLALKVDRKLLRSYWELLPEITKKEDWERTLVEKRKLSDARERMRREFPEIDAALNIWGYASTTQTNAAMKALEKKADALDVPKTRVPAIVKNKQVQDILSSPFIRSSANPFGGGERPTSPFNK